MAVSQPPAPDALAEAVRQELIAAGLPVLPRQPREASHCTGVSVEGSEHGPGVWIGWVVSDVLREAALMALEAGAYRHGGSETHPAIRHSSTVRFAMTAAIAEILEAAGYRVERDADDYRPGGLLVLEQRSGPTWRDPVGPPLAGSGGHMPGVRVRLTDGVHGESVTRVVGARHTTSLDEPPAAYLVEHPHGTGEFQVPATAIELAYEDD
ncbi:hypothetical protein [Micromonospora sp. CPCC 205561]|uniref:hypothetical protein n=1 Tax=Micromonospora sp. CPCC 205561 TaxID=3122407 RepID=UPI002FEF955B